MYSPSVPSMYSYFYKDRRLPKTDLFRKRVPDYTDMAYREAVNKLKYLLAESYTPVTPLKFSTIPTSLSYKPEERDESYSLLSRRALPPSPPKRPATTGQPPPELIAFIDRQEEYIEQLEKESQFCREELANMMTKVKEVIAENDALHQQRKDSLLKAVFETEETEEDDTEIEDKTGCGKRTPRASNLSGPNILLESRISELEAQLTQCRMELRKAQEARSSSPTFGSASAPPTEPRTMESIQRERDELNEQVKSLHTLVNQLREKEANASQKVKRSLDVVDQAQFEKNQLEMEVRRLKTELERVNEKQRETLQEASRRIGEAERRYATQIERLNSDLASQWDAASRLNLELDRARRTEQELRRELAQKNQIIEELKKDLATKTTNLQSEALTAGAERESLEAELSAARLAVERAERNGRQESARLTAEATSLRQRLDRADADLLHARKENIRLSDNIAMLEKELSLAKLTRETKDSTLPSSRDNKRDEELTSMIRDIDAKHVRSVADLENMIQSQTQLMEKLKDECQNLTQRLEDSSARHKADSSKLAESNNVLLNHMGDVWESYKEMQEYCDMQHVIDSTQMKEWWGGMKEKEEDTQWNKETLEVRYHNNE